MTTESFNVRNRIVTEEMLAALLRCAQEHPMSDAEVNTLLSSGELPSRYAEAVNRDPHA